MDAYRSYCALMGFDDHCAAYVAHYSAAAETPTPAPSSQERTLRPGPF